MRLSKNKIKALHYCEVLNKIYWKIPKTDPERIAAEATEALFYKAGKPMYSVQWNNDLEEFRVKKINYEKENQSNF